MALGTDHLCLLSVSKTPFNRYFRYMQYPMLEWLRCPVTKTPLRLKVLTEFEKKYTNGLVREIKEGLLFSEAGFVFPIIDGIPRMLVETIYDYKAFLGSKLPGYAEIKKKLEEKYGDLLKICSSRNKKTKKTFEFEWSFLNTKKKDRIWQEPVSGMRFVFLRETGRVADYFADRTVIDIGSGHGVMTSKIAEIAALAIGVEISKAVENAYNNNTNSNAWYLQADLQHLPFADHSFDSLYSSGVIHHTPNTEYSLSLIEKSLKPGGDICLWLYHPQKSTLHHLSLLLRKITSRLPLWLSFLFLSVFVFPFTFLLKSIKRKKAPNYREEIIDLLDAFTPEYRFEIQQEEAIKWLEKRNYSQVSITTTNQFGFSITGIK